MPRSADPRPARRGTPATARRCRWRAPGSPAARRECAFDLALQRRVVVLQTHDETRHRLVELPAQLVIAIAAHFRDLRDRELDDLQRRALVQVEVQPVADLLQQRRALRHLGGDEAPRVLLRQQVVEAAERRLEQRVMALVLGEDVEQLRRRAGEVELAMPADTERCRKRCTRCVVDRAERVGEEARRRRWRRCRRSPAAAASGTACARAGTRRCAAPAPRRRGSCAG